MTAAQSSRIEHEKRLELDAIYKKYDTGEFTSTPDGLKVPVYDFPEGMEEELDARMKELGELHDQSVKLGHAERALQNAEQIKTLSGIENRLYTGSGRHNYQEQKSPGEIFTESFEFKNRARTQSECIANLDGFMVNFKTLLTTAGSPGFAPDSPRSSRVVPYAERPLVISDLIPVTPTDIVTHKWMEEQAPTWNASQIGEGAAKLESSLDWNEVTQGLTKLAHWAQATEEQLQDIPGMQSLINNRLIYGLRQQEETQLLLGNGVGNNMQGFLLKSGIQTQAFSTNNADTILKAITLVQWTGYANPDAVIMHPSDWETTRLIKGATNQDYVLGSPLIDVQPRLWGLPVIITNAITDGTSLVGAFGAYSEIRRKTGMTIRVSDSHASNFVSNIYVILAEVRELLAIYRGAAFCKTSGMT